MNVLHLYANHKWTGPADLALQLVRALQGLEVAGGTLRAELAIAGFVHAGMEHAVRPRAQALGIACREGLSLRRHLHLPSLAADAVKLARWIDAGDVDLVHCHQAGDHLTAAVAQALAVRRVPLVRSLYDAGPPRRAPRAELAFARTAAVCVAFAAVGRTLPEALSLQPLRVAHVPPPLAAAALDLAGDAAPRLALRAELGLAGDALLVGVTARIQRRRQWDLLWEALARLAPCWPSLHLAVLGRPDAGVFAEVCEQPLAARGLRDRVHFLGYRAGAAYFEALRAFDVFVLVAPGSDATCRALREAMAVGLPVVAVRAAGLEEIVGHGADGWLAKGEPDDLSAKVALLLADRQLRRRMGGQARRRAALSWAPDLSAFAVRAVYEQVMAAWPGVQP